MAFGSGKPDAEYVIGARDASKAAFSSFKGNLKKAGLVAAAAGGAAVAGVAAVGVASVKMAADFESGIREVGTLLGGLSDNEIGEFRRDILGLSKELGVEAGDLVSGLYQAISAGVPRDNVIDFLRTSAKAGVGGVSDTLTAVDALSTAVNAFAGQGLTADEAADSLFATVKGGKTTFGELASTIGKISPLANAAGVSFQEMNAAVATLTLGGFSTREAGTGIKNIFSSVSRIEPSEVRDLFGLDSIEEAFAEFGLKGVIDRISEHAGGSSAVLLEMLGNVQAATAVLALSGSNSDKFAGQLQNQADATGAAAAAFEEMQKTFHAAIAKIKAQGSALMIELGSRILPALTAALGAFGGWFAANEPRISKAIDEIAGRLEELAGEARKAIRKALPPLRELLDGAIRPLAEYLRSNREALVGAIAALGVAIAAALVPALISAAAAIGAILLPLALVAAAVAGALVVWRLWGEDIRRVAEEVANVAVPLLGQAFGNIVSWWEDSLRPTLQEFAAAFREDVGPTLEAAGALIARVANAAAAVFERVWPYMERIVQMAMTNLSIAIETGLRVALGVVNTVMALIRGDWSRAWEEIKGIADAVLDGVRGVLGSQLDTLRDLLDLAKGDLLAPFEWLRDRAGDVMTAMWDGLKDGAKAAVNGLIALLEAVPNAWVDAWNALIKAWNSIEFPRIELDLPFGQSVGAGPWGVPTIPEIPPVSIPRLAEGGVVASPTTAVVGERGPEAVLPLASFARTLEAAVARGLDAARPLAPAPAFAGDGGGRGGRAPEIRVYVGERELLDIVVEANDRAMRLGYR